MKHVGRLMLLALALAVGGLGYLLLPGFEPVKMLTFAAACMILGEILYQIDKRISQ